MSPCEGHTGSGRASSRSSMCANAAAARGLASSQGWLIEARWETILARREAFRVWVATWTRTGSTGMPREESMSAPGPSKSWDFAVGA